MECSIWNADEDALSLRLVIDPKYMRVRPFVRSVCEECLLTTCVWTASSLGGLLSLLSCTNFRLNG